MNPSPNKKCADAPKAPPPHVTTTATDGATRVRASTTQQHDAASPATEAPSCVKLPMWLHPNEKTMKEKATNKIILSKSPGTPKKASRKGKKIKHTIEQKLEIIQHYKGLDNNSGVKAEYAKNIRVSTNSITRWIQNEKDLQKAIEQGRGKKKTRYDKDPLRRIKQLLLQFYEKNERLPEAQKINITSSVLSTEAIKIKDNLLNLHEEKKLPTPLDLEEVAAISNFTASKSWSGKMAWEYGRNDPNYNNKMEFSLDDLVETKQGHVGKDEAAMKTTLEGCVSTKNTEVGVEKLSTDDALCGVGEDNDESDDEDSGVKAFEEKEPVSDEVIHQLAGHLNAIALRLLNLNCDEAFDRPAKAIMDVSNDVLRAHQKMKQNRKAKNKNQGSSGKV